ncbi:MAG: VWA domain-containing protein [Deltaproteobacteria bacterium]|nr:VWA domain-containing protein [Deltaproteobacteria bacterium]
MRFAAPLGLAALALVPLVLFLQIWLERRTTARLRGAGDLALLEEMSALGHERGRVERFVSASLVAAALALVAVALARPQFGSRTEVRKARGMDVVLALDLSRSMLAQDVAPSRLGRAQIELTALTEQLPGDRIGLVGFTSVAVPLCPLTVDHSTLELQLKSASPDDLPRGGTAIGAAIREAKRMLEASPHQESGKAIVIVTDGEEHEGDPVEPAEEAKKAGIEIHLVGVGSAAGEPIPLAEGGYLKDRQGQTVITRLGNDMLEKLGAVTGGLVAMPGPEGGLELGAVRARLAQQKKAELEAREVRVYEERYRWALLPAFLLLLAATVVRPLRRIWPARTAALPSAVALVLVWPLLLGAGPLEREHPEVARGNQALADGKAGEALEAYRRAEQDVARDPALVYDQGLAQAASGELDQAIASFMTALGSAEDPSLRSQINFALGNAQRSLKKFDEAIGAYRQALLDDPAHLGARKNLELTSAMKRIQALQLKQPNPNSESSDPSDGGPPDAGDRDGGKDGGTDGGPDQPDGGPDAPDGGGQGEGDGGTSGDSGGAGGADGGSGRDGGADAGGSSASQAPETKPQKPEERRAEEILDALEAQEKATRSKRLLKTLPPGQVEKDW